MKVTNQAWEPYLLSGKNNHAVLLLHGFTSVAASLRPLADALFDAGYTVYAPNLSGHAATQEDMRETGWRDWQKDALDAFDRLFFTARHVSVIGHSMGALLALLTAARRPVWQCVTVSPPLLSRRPGQYFLPLIAPFKPETRWGAPDANQSFPEEYPLGYAGYPTAKLFDLNRLAFEAGVRLRRVQCPLLCVLSGKDRFVHPASGKLLLRRASSVQKKCVTLRESPHSPLWGPEQNVLIGEILDFLET